MGSPTPPPPGDVPAKGLLIQGGPGSGSGTADNCSAAGSDPATACNAYAALVYAVPDGEAASTVKLEIHDVSGSGSTPDATPGATLELCPLRNAALDAEQGGPMSDAPAFDCSRSVTAPPDGSGKSYTFDVKRLPVHDGSLSFAILSTLPSDRVVLDPPGEHSVQLAGKSSASEAGVVRFLLGWIW